jgi:hypothetical protein
LRISLSRFAKYTLWFSPLGAVIDMSQIECMKHLKVCNSSARISLIWFPSSVRTFPIAFLAASLRALAVGHLAAIIKLVELVSTIDGFIVIHVVSDARGT